MTATPSAFVGDAPREQCHLQDRCRVGETDKAPERSDTLPVQGVFVLGAPGPTCTFILVQEHWSLSEAEE